MFVFFRGGKHAVAPKNDGCLPTGGPVLDRNPLTSFAAADVVIVDTYFFAGCVSRCFNHVLAVFGGRRPCACALPRVGATAQDAGGDGAQEGGGETKARGGGAQEETGGGGKEKVRTVT